jgi:hypothetical protein
MESMENPWISECCLYFGYIPVKVHGESMEYILTKIGLGRILLLDY